MLRQQRIHPPEEQEILDDLQVADEEIEAMLAETEASEKKPSFWNLQNLLGLMLVLVGLAYLLQQAGIWTGIQADDLVAFLPWLAAAVILLTGLGILSREKKPRKKARRPRKTSKVRKPSSMSWKPPKGKRLTRSRNRKIAGVCAGIAEYVGMDPFWMRLAFILGTFFSGGQLILVYLLLAFVMPPPDEKPEQV